jgi:hypothetical protein
MTLALQQQLSRKLEGSKQDNKKNPVALMSEQEGDPAEGDDNENGGSFAANFRDARGDFRDDYDDSVRSIDEIPMETIIATLNIELNAPRGNTTSFPAGGMVASLGIGPFFCCESVRQPPTSDVFSKDPPRFSLDFLLSELARGSQNIINENERPGNPGIVERRRESKFIRSRPLG